MVGLTNDKRCLIQSAHEETPGFRKNSENVFKYMTTFKLGIIIINSKMLELHSYFSWRQTKLCLQTTTQRHLLTLPPPFVSVSLILLNCVLSIHNKRICYVMLC